VNLTAYREAVADALTDLSDDWTVLAGPVDALAPPCFMIQWGPDPWRVPQGACFDACTLEVWVVVGRHQPAELDTLEAMVDAAAAALQTAGFRHQTMLAPAPLDIGKHVRIAARIQITQPVTIGED